MTVFQALRQAARYNVLTPAALLLVTVGSAQAQTLTNTGTINGQVNLSNYSGGPYDTLDNSGTISFSTDAINSFSSGSVINRSSGVIEATSAGSGIAINVIDDIDNAGTISGVFAGIYTSTIDEIDNSGSITGDTYGIYSGSIRELHNSGTISGAYGLIVYDGSQTIDTLINEESGVIEGTSQYGMLLGKVGDLTNHGEITGLGAISVSGSIDSFTNTGTITGGDWGGVLFQNTLGDFDNSGEITSTASTAVHASMTTDSFINSGRIESIGGGDAVVLAGFVTSFENSGTISSDDDGVQLQQGVDDFVNRGTISGGMGSGDYGLSVQNSSGSFENWGTISGSTGVIFTDDLSSAINYGTIAGGDDWGLFLQGDTGSFTNASGATISSEGDYAFYNTDDLGSFVNEAGALIDGGVYLTLDGTGENAGTIIGDLGDAALVISGSTSSGSSFVNTGTIRGEGTAGVRIDAWDVTFINSGRIEGDAGELSILMSAPYGTLKVLTGSELVGKIGTSGNSIFDASEYTGTTVFDLTGGSGSFTQVLLNTETGMFYDAGQVVSYEAPGTTLPGIASADVVGALRDVISGEIMIPEAGVVEPMAYAASSENPAAAAAGSLDAAPARGQFFARAFGGLTLDVGSADADSAFGGLTAGGAVAVDERTRLGVLVAYARTESAIEANDQTIGTDTAVVGAYGRSDFGAVALDYSLLGGGSGHSSSRTIIAGASEEDVEADYASWFVAPTIGLAIPVLSSDQGGIRLAGSAGYVYGRTQGYTESGTTFSASLPGTLISVLDGRIELNGDLLVSDSPTGAARLTGRLGLAGQYNEGQSVLPAVIDVAGGASGSIDLAATPGSTSYGVYAGLGLNADLGEGRMIDVGADYSHRDDGSSAIAVRGGLVGAF